MTATVIMTPGLSLTVDIQSQLKEHSERHVSRHYGDAFSSFQEPQAVNRKEKGDVIILSYIQEVSVQQWEK